MKRFPICVCQGSAGSQFDYFLSFCVCLKVFRAHIGSILGRMRPFLMDSRKLEAVVIDWVGAVSLD